MLVSYAAHSQTRLTPSFPGLPPFRPNTRPMYLGTAPIGALSRALYGTEGADLPPVPPSGRNAMDRASQARTPPTPRGYETPPGVGVIPWILASLVSAVIALACFGVSYVGSLVASGGAL
jgi:hypothetical protein